MPRMGSRKAHDTGRGPEARVDPVRPAEEPSGGTLTVAEPETDGLVQA